jgi:hypothetical protein
VYRNGALLGSADFTATNGTTVVLANPASSGDLVETVSFYVSSVLNAIPAVANAVTTSYINDGAVTSAKLANLTTLPTSGGNITLPSVTGTAMVSGNMPAFSAYISASQNVTSNVDTKIAFNTEEFDTANCFDTSTYRFTPNVAGYYEFNLSVSFSATAITNNEIAFYKNGSYYKRGAWNTGGQQISSSVLIYLNGSTDYVEFYGILVGTSPQFFGSNPPRYTWVTGYLARTA